MRGGGVTLNVVPVQRSHLFLGGKNDEKSATYTQVNMVCARV